MNSVVTWAIVAAYLIAVAILAFFMARSFAKTGNLSWRLAVCVAVLSILGCVLTQVID